MSNLPFYLIGFVFGALLVSSYCRLGEDDNIGAGWHAILAIFLMTASALLIFA